MKTGYGKDGKNKAKSGALKLIVSCIFCAFLMLSAMAFSAASDSKPEKIILLTLNYKDDALSVKDISWTRGFVPVFAESSTAENNGIEKASIKIYSQKEKIIYESYFYVGNKRFQDSIDESTGELKGGIVELNDVDFAAIVPYLKEIGYIEIHSSYNDIELEYSKIKKAKELKIPSAGGTAHEGEKDAGNDIVEDDANETENSSETKSFLLEFVGIIDSVYHYIFG